MTTCKEHSWGPTIYYPKPLSSSCREIEGHSVSCRWMRFCKVCGLTEVMQLENNEWIHEASGVMSQKDIDSYLNR